MLRRNSSNPLSRRKSTSSVHSKHESIDPEVARHYAQTAATLAFARAQERNQADLGHRGSGHSRSNTTSSHIDQQPQSAQVNHIGNADQALKRQQSVRFVGPNAVHRRQSLNNKAAHASIDSKASSATLRPVAMTTNAPVPAAYRPPSRSSSIGKASTGKGRPESLVTAVAAYNEYYTREDDVASTPSSYRRIRRSKSMFSPLRAPSVFYTNGTPEQSGGSHDHRSAYRAPQRQPHEGTLRVQKSMSFLRGGRDHISQEGNDEAVQLARDRFFQQTAQQRLREQPSFLFRSKAQRQEKPFRKSVRSMNKNTSYLADNSPAPSEQAKAPRLREKARKASKSIKERFRKVFGLNTEPVQILNQQVEARETHVRRYHGDSDIRCNSFDDIPHPTETSLSRVASRPPSIYEAKSNQQLRSYAGSVKSALSDSSVDRSRVTSWNSTGVSTLTSQAAKLQVERELQRLSIINENGTHVPSSSISRPKTNQTSAYPIHHRTSKNINQIPPVPGPVNSARVYSALMKRLDENSPKAKLQASRNSSMESLLPVVKVRQRSNSLGSRGSRTPATIRLVHPEITHDTESYRTSEHEHQWVHSDSIHSARAEDLFGITGRHVHRWVTADPLREVQMRHEDDVFSPKEGLLKQPELTIKSQRHRESTDPSVHVLPRQTSTKAPYPTVPESVSLLSEADSCRSGAVAQGLRPLRESRSTFFGGGSITISRTTSPFRRALAAGDHGTLLRVGTPRCRGQLSNPLYLGPESPLMTASEGNAPREIHKAYSESVYSRTTSGQGPAAASSNLSLLIHTKKTHGESPLDNTDNVVITQNYSYQPTMPGSRTSRVASSAGSTEWKTWMSSEVAKLEKTKENTNTSASYVNFALPTMPKAFHAGHIRECAQIGDDDTDHLPGKARTGKQPLGTLQQKVNMQNIPQLIPQDAQTLKPMIKNLSVVSLVENVDSPAPSGAKSPIPPPPPIPIRSPLRIKQSKASLHSLNTISTASRSVPNSTVKVSSLSGKNLLHKRNGSTATLKNTKGAETPGRLVKKPKTSPHTTGISIPGYNPMNAIYNPVGSTSTRSRTPGSSWNLSRENHNPDVGRDEIYDTDGAGLMGPNISVMDALDTQQLGSKRMVDLFLSSRRRRIAGGSEESSGIFI